MDVQAGSAAAFQTAVDAQLQILSDGLVRLYQTELSALFARAERAEAAHRALELRTTSSTRETRNRASLQSAPSSANQAETARSSTELPFLDGDVNSQASVDLHEKLPQKSSSVESTSEAGPTGADAGVELGAARPSRVPSSPRRTVKLQYSEGSRGLLGVRARDSADDFEPQGSFSSVPGCSESSANISSLIRAATTQRAIGNDNFGIGLGEDSGNLEEETSSGVAMQESLTNFGGTKVAKASFVSRLRVAQSNWPMLAIAEGSRVAGNASQHRRSSSASNLSMDSCGPGFGGFRGSIISPLNMTSGMRTGEASRTQHCMQHLMLFPSDRRNIFLDLVGFAFIMWDLWTIPFLVAFEPPSMRDVDYSVALVSAIFWTLEIPRTFFVGVHVKGLIEVRPLKVALRYAGTWLIPDLALVLFDWLFFALRVHDLANENEPQGILRTFRSARTIRMLRMLRLIRLVKMQKLLQYFMADFHGENFSTMLELFLRGIILVVISHYIACFWYLIGDVSRQEGKINWVDEFKLFDQDFPYHYATSFHWALTQFAPSTIEIHPTSTRERIYGNAVVLFAMFYFCSVLSAMTSKLSFLRNKYKENHKAREILWRYFSENKISVDLARCIHDIFLAKMSEKPRRLHEQDIPVLKQLPHCLSKQLHVEVYSPIICHHPLFQYLRSHDQLSLVNICQSCMRELNFRGEEDVFVRGERCAQMYFVIFGSLTYIRGQVRFPVKAQDWVSEAVLWFPQWEHRGNLMAASPSDMVGLSSSATAFLMSSQRPCMLDFVKVYVSHFLRDEVESAATDALDRCALVQSDLWGGIKGIGALVGKAALQVWGDELLEEYRVSQMHPAVSLFSLRFSPSKPSVERGSPTSSSSAPATLDDNLAAASAM